MNIPIPSMTRKAYIKVPGNVWCHLADLGFTGCPDVHGGNFLASRWCLELLKAMRGLCDAPLLWQLCLKFFFIYIVHGFCSTYDDNHFCWKKTAKQLQASATAHVDDCNVSSTQQWLNATRALLEKQFGKVKRQLMPMIHVGMMYERIPTGGIHLHQEPCCVALKPIEYDKTKKHDVETDAKDQHKFMVCLGGLLYLCLTRWDLIVDIVVLQ